MLLNNRTKLILFALATTLLAVSASVKFDTTRLTINDGLPSNTVFDIWQDDKGFIWFATKNGVSRYDSYSMLNYTRHANVGKLIGAPTDALLWYAHDATYGAIDLRTYKYLGYEQADSATTYTKSLLGHHGLWVYDYEHGARFIYHKNGILRFNNYNKQNKKLSTNNVRKIRVSPDGKAWISTDNGIYMTDILGNTRNLQPGIDSPNNIILGDKVCFLDKQQSIHIFTLDGRRLGSAAIPSVLLNMKNIGDVFAWNNKVIIGTPQGYFAFYPNKRKIEALTQYDIREGKLLDQFDDNYFVQDKDFNLWAFTHQGKIEKLSLVPNSKFTHAHRRKYMVRPTKSGKFAITTYGNGLFIYNPNNGELEHFTADDKAPVIASNYIERLFVDRQGSIWLNEAFLGISYITPSQTPEVDFAFTGKANHGDWSNNICMLTSTPNGDAMVGTRDNKLYRLDAKTHQLSFVQDLQAPAYSYYEDAQGHQWLGTRGGGFYVDGVRYATDEPIHKTPCNDYHCIISDKKGNIWMGTPNYGLIQTRYEKGKPLKFKQYLKRSFNESFVSSLDMDHNGNLWVATTNGLYYLSSKVQQIKDESFTIYNASKHNFPYDGVTLVKCTADGYIWAASNGKGLTRSLHNPDDKTLKTQVMTTQEGLANNNVNGMIDDHMGNLWVSTDNGLSVIGKNDLKAKLYPLSKTAEQNITVSRCCALLSDKTVAFGTLYGVALLNTLNHERKTETVNAPCVTDLLINGKSIITNDAMPDFENGIKLTHNNNSLTFHFSNFDYASSRHTLYQYYLEGVDETWHNPTTVNTAEYGNLAPGFYTLHMRTLGGDNLWSKENTYHFTIMQPWYNTWVAWLFYLALLAFIIWYVWQNWKEKFDLRQQMKVEKQLSDFRINFFTHITHEFRTPLAIIQNAIDKIVSEDGTQTSKTNMQTAKRGTRRLLRLVNQLMEFRRISTKNIRLEVERADIVAYVRDIYQDFWAVAKQKEQILTFTPFERKYEMLFDKHIVETVVYNLLSNAVKYTPTSGTITLKLKKEGEDLHIICIDNGPGISSQQRQELFQPFMHGYVSQGGMGIGLYTAHEMAKKHHGNLSLLQKEDDQPSGATFDFQLPLDENIYTADEYRTSQAISTENMEEKQAESVIHEMKNNALNSLHIAIIEDDPDMMGQLKTELSTYFQIDGYMDGKTGYEGICNNKPALIVCDVMLPDMNGFDIVKKLKQSQDMQCIPVIMLTALDDDNHKLKGYEAGADDYMVKPCNFHLLLARIVQLITWYRKFQPNEKELQAAEPRPIPKVETTITKEGGKEEKIITSIADRNFINKMQAIVAQHIGDNDFTVDLLASQLCMGRTKFYGKVKDLLGVSPNKYINNERMRIAGELIIEGELTIAEVGYRVGITDPSYFNKCFKAYYGCVPSKYGK